MLEVIYTRIRLGVNSPEIVVRGPVLFEPLYHSPLQEVGTFQFHAMLICRAKQIEACVAYCGPH